MEDVDSEPVSDTAGSPLHRETVLNVTEQLTADTADAEDGSMPSVLYMRSSDRASFCTAVDVVDAVDGDEVTTAVVAVDVGLVEAFLRGEHTGQSERTQFFQCQIICRRIAQCGTEIEHTVLLSSDLSILATQITLRCLEDIKPVKKTYPKCAVPEQVKKGNQEKWVMG